MKPTAIFGAALVLFLGVACSRGAATPSGSTPQDDGIAPQTITWSPAKIVVVPSNVHKGDTFEVRSTLAPGGDEGGTWTASHIWLDRQINGKWQTAWVLDTRGQSHAIGPSAQPGSIALTLDGRRVPGVLTFTLDPAPTLGKYRLRLGVSGSTPNGSETPGWRVPSYWSVTDIEVVA
jgi:hypothetical protein